jgi:two-component system response regulator VicR
MGTSQGHRGVIVADDDAMIRNILRANLEAIGQDVSLAYNGQEAVKLASQMRASLVILDVKMPKLNGFEACERIRRMPGYEIAPIVMLTFDDRERTRVLASRCGATMFLVKPFGSAALMLALSEVLPVDEATLKTIQANAIRAAGGRSFAKMRS